MLSVTVSVSVAVWQLSRRRGTAARCYSQQQASMRAEIAQHGWAECGLLKHAREAMKKVSDDDDSTSRLLADRPHSPHSTLWRGRCSYRRS